MTDREPLIEVEDEEIEVVDGLPVLVEVHEAQPQPSLPQAAGGLPAKQTAAVAAGGFLAGAATTLVIWRQLARALARHQRSRSAVGARRRSASEGHELLDVVAVRSFLIDIHLLGRRDD